MSSAGTLGEMRQCGHCGCFHYGQCPRVKAVEYYPDGTVKRFEYHHPVPPETEAVPGPLPGPIILPAAPLGPQPPFTITTCGDSLPRL